MGIKKLLTMTQKEQLIKKLLEKKAEENNTIDLDAYALGLKEMYENTEYLREIRKKMSL